MRRGVRAACAAVLLALVVAACGDSSDVDTSPTTSIVSGECVPEARAKCRDADLQSADLAGRDLSGIDLRRANLAGAKLAGTNFTDANLIGADLSGADLSGAVLVRAALDDANLSTANLYGARLTSAKLRRAMLAGATMINVFATDADFTGSTDGDFSRTFFCNTTMADGEVAEPSC